MNEAFKILVTYKGQDLSLPAEFIVLRHVYKIQLQLNGQEVTFEPDEEGEFRAIITSKNLKNGKKIEVDLIKAVAEKLEYVCKTKANATD